MPSSAFARAQPIAFDVFKRRYLVERIDGQLAYFSRQEARAVPQLGRLRAGFIISTLLAIVFTAGIGENSRSLRERVCRDAEWLGVALDADANAANASRISTPASPVSAWVIPTNEELMIARHTRALLAE